MANQSEMIDNPAAYLRALNNRLSAAGAEQEAIDGESFYAQNRTILASPVSLLMRCVILEDGTFVNRQDDDDTSPVVFAHVGFDQGYVKDSNVFGWQLSLTEYNRDLRARSSQRLVLGLYGARTCFRAFDAQGKPSVRSTPPAENDVVDPALVQTTLELLYDGRSIQRQADRLRVAAKEQRVLKIVSDNPTVPIVQSDKNKDTRPRTFYFMPSKIADLVERQLHN